MRSVAPLLAVLLVLGVALQHFGYGTRPRAHAPAASSGQAQAQAERSLTLLDVWAQSIVPSMLLEQSRAHALGARRGRLAARLGRRLRARLLRASAFQTDLERDPTLRSSDSVEARALQETAAAWRDWASALLAGPLGPSGQSGSREIAALEARAVRLHQAAYAAVDDSLRTALTHP